MKIFLALCLLFAVATANHDFTPKTFDEFDRIRNECAQENHVPDDLFHEIKNFKFQNVESVRCYVKCTAKKLGYWDEKNGYNADRFYDTVVSTKTVSTDINDLKKCFDHKKDDEDFCEWAYRNYNCVIENKYVTKKH